MRTFLSAILYSEYKEKLTMDSSDTVKKLRDSWFCFYQTFLGLGLGKLFPARESFVSDIPAGEGNTGKLFYSMYRTILLYQRESFEV